MTLVTKARSSVHGKRRPVGKYLLPVLKEKDSVIHPGIQTWGLAQVVKKNHPFTYHYSQNYVPTNKLKMLL